MPDQNKLPDHDKDRTQAKPYPPARQDDAVEVPAGEARTFDRNEPAAEPSAPREGGHLGAEGDPAEGKP